MAGRQNWNYRLVNACTEHQKQPVYCVSFNLIDPAHRHLFASCGGRQVTVCVQACSKPISEQAVC